MPKAALSLHLLQSAFQVYLQQKIYVLKVIQYKSNINLHSFYMYIHFLFVDSSPIFDASPPKLVHPPLFLDYLLSFLHKTSWEK